MLVARGCGRWGCGGGHVLNLRGSRYKEPGLGRTLEL